MALLQQSLYCGLCKPKTVEFKLLNRWVDMCQFCPVSAANRTRHINNISGQPDNIEQSRRTHQIIMLQSDALLAFFALVVVSLGCCAAHNVDQRPTVVPLPMWSKRDYENITDRHGEWSAPNTEQFQFNTRIPKKPFTKKNNWLSFETQNDKIEVIQNI